MSSQFSFAGVVSVYVLFSVVIEIDFKLLSDEMKSQNLLHSLESEKNINCKPFPQKPCSNTEIKF